MNRRVRARIAEHALSDPFARVAVHDDVLDRIIVLRMGTRRGERRDGEDERPELTRATASIGDKEATSDGVAPSPK